ncbi:MAG: DUF3604 domain-containing protein [Pseudomonadota bacterium]
MDLTRPGVANTPGIVRDAVDPTDLGHAELSPKGAFEAGSWQTFTLTYTAGKFGVDDTGSLRICFRFAADMTLPQFSDPKAPGYTMIKASNNAVLEYRFDVKGNVRPWDKTVYIKVMSGYLKKDDTITLIFGDRSLGSPGMRIQTYCEDTFEFRVLVDPIATFNYQTLPSQNEIAIVPGPPVRYVAVLPTMVRAGESFALKIKGEDRWGNPSDQCTGVFTIRSTIWVANLPDRVALHRGSFAAIIDALMVGEAGDLRIELLDDAGAVVAEANPLRIVEASPFRHYWADLHGQSEETVGTGSARQYFAFARDRAFVDASCHQGNDFQMTGEFWQHLNALTAEFDAPGKFVCIPGYEWSGNTGMGGDRNVMFPVEGRTIRRSSHALIEDQSEIETDCHTANELFEALADNDEWDTVVMAHCGGRYADINIAHDGRFETSVEVHSSWGTFEWLVHDVFEQGYRLGIVANSDGHKGRPGASYPGVSFFGAIGGLTCFLTDELSRESILECLRHRRHYGTTGGPGGRMLIALEARFTQPGTRYHQDPKIFDTTGEIVSSALMGDIVHLPDGEVELGLDIVSPAPIERLDIFNGKEHLETIRPYDQADLSARIRVVWEGAQYRGRSRQVIWDGSARFIGNTIKHATPINFFNPDRKLEKVGDDGLAWRSLTTGNFAGFDASLTEPMAGVLEIETPLINERIEIGSIGLEDLIIDRSDILPRFLKVFRLPERNPHRSLKFSRRIPITASGDNPIYVRLTQEDGTRAWTSPVYVFRQH